MCAASTLEENRLWQRIEDALCCAGVRFGKNFQAVFGGSRSEFPQLRAGLVIDLMNRAARNVVVELREDDPFPVRRVDGFQAAQAACGLPGLGGALGLARRPTLMSECVV